MCERAVMNEIQAFGCFYHPPTSTQPEELYQTLAQQAGLYLGDGAAHDLLARAYLRAAEAHKGVIRDSGVSTSISLSSLREDVARVVSTTTIG